MWRKETVELFNFASIVKEAVIHSLSLSLSPFFCIELAFYVFTSNCVLCARLFVRACEPSVLLCQGRRTLSPVHVSRRSDQSRTKRGEPTVVADGTGRWSWEIESRSSLFLFPFCVAGISVPTRSIAARTNVYIVIEDARTKRIGDSTVHAHAFGIAHHELPGENAFFFKFLFLIKRIPVSNAKQLND